MKKIVLFFLLFIVCFSVGIMASEELLIDLNFAVSSEKQITGVGIQHIGGEYQLTLVGSEDQNDQQVIIRSNELLLDPKLAVSDQNQVITYLKESQGNYYLYLLKKSNDNWVTTNQGVHINDYLKPIQVMSLALKGNQAYVAFIQDHTLRIVQYNLEDNLLATRYQQKLDGQMIDNLTLDQHC